MSAARLRLSVAPAPPPPDPLAEEWSGYSVPANNHLAAPDTGPWTWDGPAALGLPESGVVRAPDLNFLNLNPFIYPVTIHDILSSAAFGLTPSFGGSMGYMLCGGALSRTVDVPRNGTYLVDIHQFKGPSAVDLGAYEVGDHDTSEWTGWGWNWIPYWDGLPLPLQVDYGPGIGVNPQYLNLAAGRHALTLQGLPRAYLYVTFIGQVQVGWAGGTIYDRLRLSTPAGRTARLSFAE